MAILKNKFPSNPYKTIIITLLFSIANITKVLSYTPPPPPSPNSLDPQSDTGTDLYLISMIIAAILFSILYLRKKPENHNKTPDSRLK